MKVLTIRNIPEKVYETLTSIAKDNRRSLQQQALLILEQSTEFFKQSHGSLERALLIRKSLENRDLGNTLKDLREERDR